MEDIEAIQKIMPHRYPMLLVDRIISTEENKVVGIKNVTYNEPFFQGHFQGHPVMPGVLIIEAMAQVAGVLILSGMKKEGFIPFFLGIDFKAKREDMQSKSCGQGRRPDSSGGRIALWCNRYEARRSS